MSTSNKPAIDPEAFARLNASLKQAGAAMVATIKPIGDALTIAYGPQRAVCLEREAAAATDPTEAARLAGEAAQASAAVTRALRRVERRRRQAEAERARVTGQPRDGE